MNFKRLILLSFLALGITYSQKIGYVDSKVISEKYSEAQVIAKKIQDLQKKYEDQFIKLQSDYKDLGEKFETQKLTLTQAKKDELIRKIQGKEQEIRNFQQSKLVQPNGELFQKVQEIQAPLIEKIVKAIEMVAKEKKLDIVLDNVNSIVLYTSDAVNYTNDVLAELERNKTN
ncbi:MAG: OmpH family outer membrane protein [Calditrichaeota bacterium]|nr:OmpH family outer membrane protein [Calditrichota bacterium]